MSLSIRRLVALLWPLLAAAPLHAQETAFAPAAPVSPAADDKISLAIRDALTKGQALLNDNDPAAVATLRVAAQNALKALSASVGGNALTLSAPPDDALTDRLTPLAIEAHALWGRAADQFGERDEAITALVRAKTLLAKTRVLPDETLVRDFNLELSGLLRGGLPLVAPDDVLDGIATRSHENLWRAHRFDFAPAQRTALDALPRTALLVTEGQLFPPALRNQSLVQIPPFYRPSLGITPEETLAALDRLPQSVKLNRMVAGYERVAAGANVGQWRQTVRVFYASPFLTRANRDDAPRAELLAAQFLRVHALFASQLGAANLYTHGTQNEGVTTLYLLEISALWPQDDDDPVVLATSGPKMPPINTGPKPKVLSAQPTALMRPWQALAGQTEGAAPGEIMFWKAGFARSEGEWTRELFHEYGHVALPPFGGFVAPLESYGNGLIGETLGMLWAAQNPDALGDADARADALLHVERQALPARRFFAVTDPTLPRLDGSAADLKFLQGLCVVTERAYGAPMLGRAFTPLAQKSAATQNVAARRTLMRTPNLIHALDWALNATFAAKKSLPIYLPAALDAPLSASELANRAPLQLKAGARASGWLLVPSGAATLHIDSPDVSVLGVPFKHESGGTTLYFGGKGGWQKITLVATNDATLLSASFE